jgi:hypothetical protein
MVTNKQAAILTKCRVLCAVNIDGVPHQPDDVVELDESNLYLYRKSVDPHPDSVTHAENIHRRAKARHAFENDIALE